MIETQKITQNCDNYSARQKLKEQISKDKKGTKHERWTNYTTRNRREHKKATIKRRRESRKRAKARQEIKMAHGT